VKVRFPFQLKRNTLSSAWRQVTLTAVLARVNKLTTSPLQIFRLYNLIYTHKSAAKIAVTTTMHLAIICSKKII